MDRVRILAELNSYIKYVDKDITMILQSLQWDKNRLFESPQLVSCSYDHHHRMPHCALANHEARCLLRSDGYSPQEELLPDPPYCAGRSLVKLDNAEIQKIINDAEKFDPLFKRVIPTQLRILTIHCPRPPPADGRDSRLQPCSHSRLVATYSRDERRAIHDAVVANAPRQDDSQHCCEMIIPLAASTDGDTSKSRAELLALERNMRRRRVKYRGAGTSTNYSHTLRDVIATQMEMYTDVKVENVDDSQSIITNTNIESIPSRSSHTSNTHRASENYNTPLVKYRRKSNTDCEMSTSSTQRETKHFNHRDKGNSHNTDDEYSSRKREEYDSKDRRSSESRYSRDRERNNTSDRHNAGHETKYQHSYDNDRKSNKIKHRDRSNKCIDNADTYRNSRDKYKESSERYKEYNTDTGHSSKSHDKYNSNSEHSSKSHDRYNSNTGHSSKSHDRYNSNTGHSSKSHDRYRHTEKRHRSGRSDSRTETTKSDRGDKSYDFDIVKVKEEPSDDLFSERKRKRCEKH